MGSHRLESEGLVSWASVRFQLGLHYICLRVTIHFLYAQAMESLTGVLPFNFLSQARINRDAAIPSCPRIVLVALARGDPLPVYGGLISHGLGENIRVQEGVGEVY